MQGRSWSETCFGILDRDGRAVALPRSCRVGDDIAWVEDVYRAGMPSSGLRPKPRDPMPPSSPARAPFAFILADDNDWPKRLYADIGFQPVGVNHQFHLEVRLRRLRKRWWHGQGPPSAESECNDERVPVRREPPPGHRMLAYRLGT